MDIFIISHDLECTFILERSLSVRDYRVTTASSYQEASHILSNGSCDLILFDITDDTDFEGMKTLQHTSPDIPVLVLSEDDSPFMIDKALELGAYDFIAKPFELSVITKRIQSAFSVVP